jgi:hypothetical protein
MAKIIEFYVPANFKRKIMVPSAVTGKLIEFPVTKKSA